MSQKRLLLSSLPVAFCAIALLALHSLRITAATDASASDARAAAAPAAAAPAKAAAKPAADQQKKVLSDLSAFVNKGAVENPTKYNYAAAHFITQCILQVIFKPSGKEVAEVIANFKNTYMNGIEKTDPKGIKALKPFKVALDAYYDLLSGPLALTQKGGKFYNADVAAVLADKQLKKNYGMMLNAFKGWRATVDNIITPGSAAAAKPAPAPAAAAPADAS